MMASYQRDNRGRLLQALLLLVVMLGFAACKDDSVDQKVKDDKKIQEYFVSHNIDTATVVKTNSGLYYQKLEEGTGSRIFPGDVVLVDYKGMLLNDTEFDSSYERGEPYQVTVGISSVIAGWHEGLQLMRVGEKARLFIPSHLGYGRNPQGVAIPANSPLVFEVHVVEMQD
ncbi:FKBP-type peptidyl-prolyl cis-trans isomerase [Pontibacter mangrovi]|uniref:Peptidyl-prolyl cis-trans isomerase n=1 Tax=Pontibacter mangrovi TaxID=2589816 RepID=A0A501W861_9BACT|nr:FKBP-type peptidyl-prolyl cis-trans isomerase [Pontibacter mangrovi]TPE44912.1 peptidylprolyl isomerase [Pontibacter mangrovi]